MKKSLFFAFAVAGMLCSCSSEEAIEAGINGNDGGNNSELVPIKLGMSNSVITRGSGTVGGTDDISNVWNGQPIRVFMVDKFNLGENGELKLALDPIQPERKNFLFNDQLMYAPTGTNSAFASIVPDLDGYNSTVRYYPTGDGAYSFFAYHVDADNERGTENSAIKGDYVNENGKIYFNIEIDGSQDVMVAKADDANDKGIEPNRVFSAYAARNEVQPNLVFKHLLTRLTFKVTPNKANITIRRIAVKSKTTGQLIVAYTGEELEQLVWTPEQELSYVNLKQRSDDADKKSALIPLKEVVLDEKNGSEVGEALLVSPESEYNLLIELSQEVETGNGTDVVYYSYGDVDNGQNALLIKPNEGRDKFEAGHSYNVSVTVYGLEEIKITTTLDNWKSSKEDDVDIDPEV